VILYHMLVLDYYVLDASGVIQKKIILIFPNYFCNKSPHGVTKWI